MRNLNTHDAYAEFRDARAALRAAGETPAGLELVDNLTRYSERGTAYTKAVSGLIRSNGFEVFDDSALEEGGDSV
jgi:Bax protein